LVRYVDFAGFVPKVTKTHGIIFGVNGPRIFTKIARNVAKILPFNIFKSELRYSNAFLNASVLNKGHFANFAKNWLLWQHQLEK